MGKYIRIKCTQFTVERKPEKLEEELPRDSNIWYSIIEPPPEGAPIFVRNLGERFAYTDLIAEYKNSRYYLQGTDIPIIVQPDSWRYPTEEEHKDYVV